MHSKKAEGKTKEKTHLLERKTLTLSDKWIDSGWREHCEKCKSHIKYKRLELRSNGVCFLKYFLIHANKAQREKAKK